MSPVNFMESVVKKLLLSLLLLIPVLCFGADAFAPNWNTSTSISATTTSSSIAVSNPNSEQQIRIYNATNSIAYFRFGNSPVTATNADIPVAPNSVEIFTAAFNNVAVILSSGSGTVYFVRGTGL